MAKQSVKSGLMGKLGGHVTATEIEVKKPGGRRLPPGIENGVAQLVDCRFGQYKEGKQAGEYFFLAAGVIVSPNDVDGVPVLGEQTQIMEPMCDTPDKGGEKARKTMQEHYDWVVNQMGLLLGKKPGEKFSIGPDEMEEVAEQIKEMKPHFKFRTFCFDKEVVAQKPNKKWGLFVEDSKGNRKPSRNIGEWATEDLATKANPYAGRDPMVFETWAGACDYQQEEGSADKQVQDDTPDDAPGNSSTRGETDEPVAEEQEVPFGDDLDDLVATANQGGKKGDAAIQDLGKRAMAVGYSQDEVEAADDWESVAKMVRNPKTADEPAAGDGVDWAAVAEKANANDKKAIKNLNDATKAKGLNPDDFESYDAQAAALSSDAEPEEAETPTPAKGEVWQFKIPGQKKLTEFIIDSVNGKKRTVMMTNNDTKVPYPTKAKPESVSWDDLVA